MDVVCDLSIGGRGLGCIGNIAILAGVALAADTQLVAVFDAGGD